MEGQTLTWQERYARMKKHYDWTDKDIAGITGNTPGSIREVVRKDPFPRWLKLAIHVFEKERSEDIQD